MHVAPAFSCLEIVDDVYRLMLKDGDTFIMSKGHGAMAQYVILEDMGLLSLDDYGTTLGCHPDLGIPGIACATGSLGHGLGMAVGIAYADPKHKVYCLISDGELQEGSTWEAILLAPYLVNNIFLIIDFNGTHSSGRIKEQMEPLGQKIQAFKWNTFRVPAAPMPRSLRWIPECSIGPTAVICETVKGFPISYMENNPLWHYRSPTPEEYEKALQELA
jgi:transketolase